MVGQGAVAALYSDDMLDGFYRQNKVFTSINQEAAKTFKSLVSSSVFDKKRTLRVLEVGSGVISYFERNDCTNN